MPLPVASIGRATIQNVFGLAKVVVQCQLVVRRDQSLQIEVRLCLIQRKLGLLFGLGKISICVEVGDTPRAFGKCTRVFGRGARACGFAVTLLPFLVSSGNFL